MYSDKNKTVHLSLTCTNIFGRLAVEPSYLSSIVKHKGLSTSQPTPGKEWLLPHMRSDGRDSVRKFLQF